MATLDDLRVYYLNSHPRQNGVYNTLFTGSMIHDDQPDLASKTHMGKRWQRCGMNRFDGEISPGFTFIDTYSIISNIGSKIGFLADWHEDDPKDHGQRYRSAEKTVFS